MHFWAFQDSWFCLSSTRFNGLHQCLLTKWNVQYEAEILDCS